MQNPVGGLSNSPGAIKASSKTKTPTEESTNMKHWGIMNSTLGYHDLNTGYHDLNTGVLVPGWSSKKFPKPAHPFHNISSHKKGEIVLFKKKLSKFEGWAPESFFFPAISIGIWVTPVTLVKINKEHLQSRALNNLPVNLWWSVRGFLAISPSEPRKKAGLTFHCILVV